MVITPETPGAKWLLVYMDGIDVSPDCYFVDTDTDTVGLFQKDEDGKKFLVDGDKVAKKVFTSAGNIKFYISKDAPEKALVLLREYGVI